VTDEARLGSWGFVGAEALPDDAAPAAVVAAFSPPATRPTARRRTTLP
jgi:hypothetical protein